MIFFLKKSFRDPFSPHDHLLFTVLIVRPHITLIINRLYCTLSQTTKDNFCLKMSGRVMVIRRYCCWLFSSKILCITNLPSSVSSMWRSNECSVYIQKRANVEYSQEIIRQIALNDELRSNIGLFLRQGIPIS